jgi:hypothetical protein
LLIYTDDGAAGSCGWRYQETPGGGNGYPFRQRGCVNIPPPDGAYSPPVPYESLYANALIYTGTLLVSVGLVFRVLSENVLMHRRASPRWWGRVTVTLVFVSAVFLTVSSSIRGLAVKQDSGSFSRVVVVWGVWIQTAVILLAFAQWSVAEALHSSARAAEEGRPDDEPEAPPAQPKDEPDGSPRVAED